MLYLKNHLNNLTIAAWVTLSKASSDEEASGAAYARVSLPNKDAIEESPHSNNWTCVSDRWWSPWIHTLIHAAAIPIATVGYAMARKNNGGDTLSSEPRYLLAKRFLELLLTLFIVYGFLVTCPTIRIGWYKIAPQSSLDDTERTGSDEEDIAKDETDQTPCPSSMQVEIGTRPDLPLLFRTLQDSHEKNVFVAACGPTALVEAVRQEYKERIWSGWIIDDEEWEW